MRNSTSLALNRDHFHAANSFRRARNCLLHARLVPHTAERELASALFWLRSGHHHRSMAAFNATQPVRTWAPVRPSWRDEVEFLFITTKAEVE